MRTCFFLIVSLILFARPVSEQDPPWTSADIFVPEPYAGYIAEHINEIVSHGWGVVNRDDFYHGHVLLSPDAASVDTFDSLGHLLSFSVGAVYHTDESVARWRGQHGLPPSGRTPRSIVGIWGKPVVPAVWFIDDASVIQHYESHGTIKAFDLARAQPELFHVRWHYVVQWPDAACRTVLQFDIGEWTPPPSSRIRIGDRWHPLMFACHPW